MLGRVAEPPSTRNRDAVVVERVEVPLMVIPTGVVDGVRLVPSNVQLETPLPPPTPVALSVFPLHERFVPAVILFEGVL
jgi:hypothetical protein